MAQTIPYRRNASEQVTRRQTKRRRSHGARIGTVDGLRALAIAGVVLYHMRPSVLPGGFLGVSVFFVITGFLATRGLMRSLGRDGIGAYPRYALRRVTRLLPPVLVVIGVAAALTYLISPSLLPKVQADALPSALFFSNWSYIFRKVSYFAAAGLPSPLTHLWFLGVTMQFYLVWPLMLLILMRRCPTRRHASAAVAGLALVSALAMALMYDPAGDTARVYYGTDTRAAELLAGALLALAAPDVGAELKRTAERSSARIPDIAGGILLVALGLGFVFANGEASWLYRSGYLLVTIATAALLACSMTPGSLIGRALSTRPLVWLGSRSFSLYLVHYPLLILMNPATRTTAIPWWEQVIQLAVVLAAAEIFYRFVERPLNSSASPDREVGRSRALPYLPYLLPALGGIAAMALAFVPADWSSIAQARAEALRPELAAQGQGSNQTGTDEDGTQNEQADENAKPQPTGPDAEKIPANLDASGWTYDEATGTCNADALIIGDSVTEGASSVLSSMLPNAYVDGKVSRQLAAGPEVYAQDAAAGHGGSAVIVALGGNSLIRDKSQVQAMIDAVGGKPLFFVTIRSPYPLQDINNQILHDFANANDNVGVIDWKGASEGHSEYLVDDGVHLTEAGQQAFAGLIRKALCGR